MSKQSSYNISLGKLPNKLSNEKETVLVTKIKVIITEHDIEGGEEKLVYDEIIKLKQEENVSDKQIVTALGSVRGVKNRVRDRIELFLTGNVPKNNVDAEENKAEQQKCDNNKIIIYTTSLGIIRKTKGDCLYVINAFRSLMLKTEERDVVSELYRKEYKELYANQQPPQVIINSFHVGSRKEIEELIESGEIHLLTKNIDKVTYTAEKCINCLGFGYTNCPTCLGSGRSRVTRIGNARELNYLKCSFCKEGLIRCMDCINLIS